MVDAISIALLTIFAITLRFTGLRTAGGQVRHTAEAALKTLRDAHATDREKELAARAAAFDLIRAAVKLVAAVVLAMLPAAAILLLVRLAGLADFHSILESFTTWPVILLGALAATIALAIK